MKIDKVKPTKDSWPWGGLKAIDYSPLMKMVASLQDGEIVRVEYTSASQMKAIKDKIAEGFKHTKHRVWSRTVKATGEKYIYIAQDHTISN